jgi:superfamily II DNA or RNA helicase
MKIVLDKINGKLTAIAKESYNEKNILSQVGFKYKGEMKAWITTTKRPIEKLISKCQDKDERELLKMIHPLFVNYKVQLINNEIFIMGDTYPIKNTLWECGFKWGGYQPEAHHKGQLNEFIVNIEFIKKKMSKELFDLIMEVIPKNQLNQISLNLVIKEAWVYLNNIPYSLKKQISDIMMFEVQGAEYSQAYQEGKWDGNHRLYDFKENRFPIGFLSRVISFFNINNIKYNLIDNRNVKHELDLKWNGHKLREYQQAYIDEALKKKTGFLVAPTGAGKTEIAMKLIQELNTSTIIIVHRSELLYQWQRRLETAFGIKVGVIGDGKFSEEKITVAMIQTLINKRIVNKYHTLIVDEAHHTPADTFYSFASRVNAFYRFGLSATPERESGDEMKFIAMLGDPIQKVTVKELIEMGYLAKPQFQVINGFIPDDEQLAEIRRARGKGWQKELMFACEDSITNDNILRKTIELVNDGHLLYIDVRRIAHGNILKKMLKKNGIKVEFLRGKDSTKKRQEVLEEFAKGNGLVLISTLIKEGVDLPAISAIILAGPTSSTAANLQVIGRALRPKKGDNTAIIVDRYDVSSKLMSWFNRRQMMFKDYYGN